MRPSIVLALAFGICSLSACSVLVDSTLAGRGSPDGGSDGGGPAPDAAPTPDSGPMGACSTFPDGTPCTVMGIATRLLCIHHACGLSECGDGYADTVAGGGTEECDDGNSDDGDGCDLGCVLSCHTDADCDDGDECNGTETCGSDDVCAAGTPLADNTVCDGGTGHCVSHACLADTCGDGLPNAGEQCDDGNAIDTDGCKRDCTFTCVMDIDCPTANVCLGSPVCTAHICGAPSMTLDCSDTDPCTADACDPTTGCTHTSLAVDADGDMHDAMATTCGGDDCDDHNANAYPGAPEPCGSTADLNCDGSAGTQPLWYPDCDGDTFAAAGSTGTASCSQPTSAPSCGGRWTSIAPTGITNTDCFDSSSDARPGQASFFTSSLTGLPVAFDYNCSGTASTQPYAAPGSIPRGLSTTCSGAGRLCDGDTWWVSSTAPRCGVAYPISHCTGTLTCTRSTTTTTYPIGCH